MSGLGLFYIFMLVGVFIPIWYIQAPIFFKAYGHLIILVLLGVIYYAQIKYKQLEHESHSNRHNNHHVKLWKQYKMKFNKDNIAFVIVPAFLLSMLGYFMYNHFQTGVIKNIIFSVFLLSMFLSWYLNSKYNGRIQSIIRNLLFLIISICSFIFILFIDPIIWISQIVGRLAMGYFFSLLAWGILRPPFIENKIRKYEVIEQIILLVAPLAILLFLTIFLVLLGI
jgi:MFS family permease